MRQRIVINVDGPATETMQRPRAGGRKPRRWLRVLAILVGLMIVIFAVTAVLGFLWWRALQTSPAYTLTLLIDAAQRNDATEFEKRINDERSEEHTSELQSRLHLVCRLLLEKK